MKVRMKKYEDVSPVDILVLRDKLGFGKYRKRAKRDEEEKKILIGLGLKKIEDKERGDFIPLGYRKRRIKILP